MPKPKLEMRGATMDGAMLMAASGLLEAALADLDFLISTKASLLASHPGEAESFYRDAVAGASALRELVGVILDCDYIAWENIPPPPAPGGGKIDG